MIMKLRLNQCYFAWLATWATFLGCLATAFQLAGLRINVTPSIPLGLYITTRNVPRPGEIAEFCPTGMPEEESSRYRGYGLACQDRAIPLLKPIVAGQGDLVEFSPHGIRVNGHLLPNTAPRLVDGKGRAIRAWPMGVYTVDHRHVVVASTYHPGSYDSRYLGPIPVADMTATLRPLWTQAALPREVPR